MKRMFKISTMLLLAVVAFFPFSAVYAVAGVPQIISYQGRLADSSGLLLGGSGTTYYFKFSIWDTPTIATGAKLWPISSPGTTSLVVTDGVFNVNIGDIANGFPDALTYDFQSNDTVYLQVQVSSDNVTYETLGPRQRITSSGYALNAATLKGLTPGTGAGELLTLDSSGEIDITGSIRTQGMFEAGSNLLSGIGLLIDTNALFVGDFLNLKRGGVSIFSVNELGNLMSSGTITASNLSGTNTGDETGSTIKTKLGAAMSGVDGYLSGTDWNIFNSKQDAGDYVTELTGDIQASGPGSSVATLATVNSDVGTFGSASSVGTFTVNAKGLITTVVSTPIQITQSAVTNLVSDLSNKLSSTLTSGSLLVGNGSNIATAVNLSLSGTAGSFSLSNAGVLTIPDAGFASRGFLSSTDWNTFNAKQESGNYITALTGDAQASGPGSAALTLATVNTNTGTFGDASTIGTFTVNAKGLITSASTVPIQIPESAVTGLVNNLSGKLETTLASGKLFVGNGSNIATPVDLTLSGSAGSFALSNTGSITFPDATISSRGLLSSTDWNTFNAKESALTFSTGLTRSVHTITANLSTGISGGQSVIGGIGSGENLTLSSTTNGTKGKILFGNSAYDEVNNRLGVGMTSPVRALDVTTTASDYGGRIRGNNGGGLIIGGYSSTYGGIWSANVTPTTSNYALISTGAATHINGSSSVTLGANDGAMISVNANTAAIGNGFSIPTTSARLIVINSPNSSSAGALSLGNDSANWNGGGTSPFNGSASGTYIAINAPSLYAGNLVDFQTGGVSRFKISAAGGVTTTGSIAVSGNISTNNSSALIAGLAVFDGQSSSARMHWNTTANGMVSVSGSGIFFNHNAVAKTDTSGTVNLSTFNPSFAPTSGTGVFNTMNISPTINQTGDANGITRGIYINPTLTASVDFKAIEVTNGQSLFAHTVSGSLATSTMNISPTWNTSGNPSALLVNATNTASGSTAKLLDLKIGGVDRFIVDKNGRGTFRKGVIASADEGFFIAGGVGGFWQYSAPGTVGLAYDVAVNGGYNSGHVFRFNLGGSGTQTSGNVNLMQLLAGFAPTSGTAVFNTLNVAPTVNQTGSANGVTRGIYINPTITSAPSFRGIEIANTSGYALYQSGASTSNYLAGSLGIGNLTPAYKLEVASDSASSYAANFFNDGDNANRYGLRVQAGADNGSSGTLIDFFDGDGTQISGNITYTSGVVAYNTTSDERLKQNIVDTELSLDILKQITIHDFTWKVDPNNKINHGVIAQELERVYPDAVTAPSDPSRYYGVDYSKLTPLIIKSIQDLDIRLSENVTASSLPVRMSDFFSSVVKNVSNGIAHLKGIVTDTLTVGSPEKPTGITLYDEVTNAPFCIKVVNGVMQALPGECQVVTHTDQRASENQPDNQTGSTTGSIIEEGVSEDGSSLSGGDTSDSTTSDNIDTTHIVSENSTTPSEGGISSSESEQSSSSQEGNLEVEESTTTP